MKLAGDAPWGTLFVTGSALAGLTATPTTRSPVEAPSRVIRRQDSTSGGWGCGRGTPLGREEAPRMRDTARTSTFGPDLGQRPITRK
nr:MAG TPA: hypothetical protein [Caudoviricetes sp.]